MTIERISSTAVKAKAKDFLVGSCIVIMRRL